MKEIKDNFTYKGTRILVGNEKRNLINQMISILINNNFTEIQLPIINFYETFKDKVGEENNNLMYRFKDRGERDLCLAPEYTSLVQKLSNTTYKYEKDIKLFYVAECFRGEKPQFARYRQFTQLGIEILNPTNPEKQMEILKQISCMLVEQVTTNYKLKTDVVRGLNFYHKNIGFEIECEELDSSKQVCGGGSYDGGLGAGIGIDRILNLLK